ncbi:MAG: TolC family protein, partial [Planctomycetota bacterium]
GGMAPHVFMPGSGSELYRGLGSVVIGGLLVSTVFTLLLVPLLLSLVTDLQGRLGLLPGGGTAKEATPRPEGSAGRPRRGAAMLLPLSLFAAGLLGGCRAREARATSDDFKRLVENIVEREMAGIGAEEGTWRITAQPKTEVRDTLGERLDELERMAGPAAYEGAQTRLGPDLEGGPQGTAPLTLAEAVATAVKNNLGIEIARLQGEIAAEGVREAEAFFDPAVYSGFDLEKLDEPTTVPVLNGIALGRPVRASEQESLEVGLRGRLTTGATLSASTLLERFENDTLGIAFSPDPAWQSRVGVNLTQPLLRGSGSRVSTAEIALRRNDRRRRENDLRARVLDIAAATEEAYWDLVSARHGLLIQQRLIEQGRDVKGVLGERRDFDTAPAQYADAVATVEQRQAELLRLRRRLRAASDRLKHLLNDPELPLGSETLIEPADPLVEEPLRFHLKGAIVTALRERPEVEQAILGIDDAALREDVARNLRLPELNLTAGLSYAGLEDGAADAYGELSTDSFVSYLLGVTFELPFGNRAAKAVHRRARLEGQSARLLLRQVVQEVVREVKEALRDVETSYALIEANRSFRIAQSENLRALLAEEDTQRSPTPEFLNLKFLVQERLALARRQEIDALADYSKALAAFHRALGTTKDRTGVPPGDADGR